MKNTNLKPAGFELRVWWARLTAIAEAELQAGFTTDDAGNPAPLTPADEKFRESMCDAWDMMGRSRSTTADTLADLEASTSRPQQYLAPELRKALGR